MVATAVGTPRRSRAVYQHPWTQPRETTSGGEAQEVRYRVVLDGCGRQHVALQYRPGPTHTWEYARQTVCDQRFAAPAREVRWGAGPWCGFCLEIARTAL